MIAKTPAGVADEDSPYELEIPGEPTLAATPLTTCVQSLPDFCHVDSVAFEPPAPTTEITWVAPPTRAANHGASTRCSVFTGAATAAGRGTDELVVADDLVTLLTDAVVGTTLVEGSVDELGVVGSTDVVRGSFDALIGEACGDPLEDTTTSAATATAATTAIKPPHQINIQPAKNTGGPGLVETMVRPAGRGVR